jgi:hypothetical protein
VEFRSPIKPSSRFPSPVPIIATREFESHEFPAHTCHGTVAQIQTAPHQNRTEWSDSLGLSAPPLLRAQKNTPPRARGDVSFFSVKAGRSLHGGTACLQLRIINFFGNLGTGTSVPNRENRDSNTDAIPQI